MMRPCLSACTLLVVLLLLFLAQPAAALNLNHQCTFCHNLHGLIPPENLTDSLCLGCHGPGGISLRKAALHTNKKNSEYPPFSIGCLQCHDPHDGRTNWLGGFNLFMVGTKKDVTGLARIATPASGIRDVVFESRGTDAGGPALHSFSDGDQDGNGIYDGVCEVCHSAARHNRNDGGGKSHNLGRTCTVCHPHVLGFNR